VREIPADALAATAARTAKSCGYPAISLGLLASILRAIDALAPRTPHARDHFLVHVGMDLRPQIAGNRVDPDRPLPLSLGNIATVIPVTARRTDMTDRDAFVRFLARQFRDRVRRGWDVALVQLMTVYTRWMWVARRLTRALFRRSQSLNYGCFHSTLPAGATLATVPIVAMYHLSSAPAPPGLALIATRFQRRMILAATHDPAVVPRERADALLDQLIADFCDAGAPPEAPP
jgi:hypothetical protein